MKKKYSLPTFHSPGVYGKGKRASGVFVGPEPLLESSYVTALKILNVDGVNLTGPHPETKSHRQSITMRQRKIQSFPKMGLPIGSPIP